MKNAVIYARYSSHSQTEMSIEGQLDECRRYAEEHDLLVVQEYIDRAQSATTDKRPNFQRMIEDSRYGSFDIILVYQFDRFARNVNDSGYYRKILSDRGVSVVSAMENIASDSSGIITQGMIDTMNQWYSAQLSEKVNRGMRQKAAQGKYTGGPLSFGYTIDEDSYYVLDPVTAPIVKEIFERYADGENGTEIMKDLNERGIKTTKGLPFSKNSLQTILRNERYKGTYVYDDIKIPDAVPRIVSDELFDSVQEKLALKKRGHRPATEDYLLTGKLYCGHCKDPMNGTSGTSKNGLTHRYYKCVNSPKSCDKKNIRKDFIELLVVETCRQMLSLEVIDEIVAAIIEQNKEDQESPVVIGLKSEIKDIEVRIEKLLDQIEDGGSTRLTERLRQREDDLDRLNRQLSREQAKQKYLDPEVAREFLEDLRDGKYDNENYRKMLIRSLVDKIYLYDDHFRILFKSSKRSKTSKREAAEVERYFENKCSAISQCAPPHRTASRKGLRFFVYTGVVVVLR